MKKFNHNNYTVAYICIRPSKIVCSEVGAFALKSFKKGKIIIKSEEFEDNYLIPIDEYRKLDKETRRMVTAFCEITDAFAVVPQNINHIKNIHYMNHSCAPNVGFDHKNNYRAIRNIKKNEEFLMCYSFLYSDSSFKMKCLCKSKNCRKIITGNDWKDKKLQKQYGDYFVSTIRAKIGKND